MNRLVWFVAVQWDMPGELHAKNVLAQIQVNKTFWNKNCRSGEEEC